MYSNIKIEHFIKQLLYTACFSNLSFKNKINVCNKNKIRSIRQKCRTHVNTNIKLIIFTENKHNDDIVVANVQIIKISYVFTEETVKISFDIQI